MGLRAAKCYRRWERPYTRISYSTPGKGYAKGVPDIKIHKFEDGSRGKAFSLTGNLVVKENVQIRHNALEAARVAAVKIMEALGPENYFLKILVYPHHVLRENPLATGAGADRFQTGMRMSFGNPISKAARVRKKQAVLRIRADQSNLAAVKKALKIASNKLPVKCEIVLETGNKG